MNHAKNIAALLDETGWFDRAETMQPYLQEWRGRFEGSALGVARPATVEQLQAVVRYCSSEGLAMVPQGGNTGLAGGACPRSQHEVVISLERLHAIRARDADNNTLTVEAGCSLQTVQQAAASMDRYFPLRLIPAERCQIGGNIAANAGGTNVLHYGNTRDLILGIEAVLPNGDLFQDLGGLRKDNAGYDLKQLFIGSEGTLGIITAAVLKLYPAPRESVSLLLGMHSVTESIQFLRRAQGHSGDSVTACELMSRQSVEFAIAGDADSREPFRKAYPWYLLLEFSSARKDARLSDAAQALINDYRPPDHTLARKAETADKLWHIRKVIPAVQKSQGGSIKHDVSVAVSNLPAFLDEATSACKVAIPGIRVCAFGHLGDGNIHFNLSAPIDWETDRFLAQWERMNRIVHDVVVKYGGSIAAEHGVGQLKAAELARTQDQVSMQMMRQLKRAFDPQGLMNPGKMLI